MVPAPATATESLYELGVKSALQDRGASKRTEVSALLPVQSPDQPTNEYPCALFALKSTEVPGLTGSEHWSAQPVIPPSESEIVPPPLSTVTVKIGTTLATQLLSPVSVTLVAWLYPE